VAACEAQPDIDGSLAAPLASRAFRLHASSIRERGAPAKSRRPQRRQRPQAERTAREPLVTRASRAMRYALTPA